MCGRNLYNSYLLRRCYGILCKHFKRNTQTINFNVLFLLTWEVNMLTGLDSALDPKFQSHLFLCAWIINLCTEDWRWKRKTHAISSILHTWISTHAFLQLRLNCYGVSGEGGVVRRARIAKTNRLTSTPQRPDILVAIHLKGHHTWRRLCDVKNHVQVLHPTVNT